ncbi:Oidioi.mRNA.OKI2018_I69.chr1.g596.t1.cds [Oikopleura dioica]|uniref:Oidioi.mRNA.OKI2018_I69.chr1.g596.t1.cds n=1 Tax=Oikopleura dioica TaxID=34765 RepID=A0ABN7SKV0_OIKDI|nr:Oidioi.mRNA.OKI2018_I69.chr1.g596.t1.cds [Oikopleura dioica]
MRLGIAALPAIALGKLKPTDVFTVQPENVEVVRGSTVTLECAIDPSVTSKYTSDPAEELIQWAKGKLGLGFPPLRRERYSQQVGPNSYSLTIEDVQAEDEDDFECQFTSEGIRSKNARLTTIIAPEELQITSNAASLIDSLPAEPETTVTVIEGVEAVIDCVSIKAKPSALPKWTSSFKDAEFRGPWEVYDSDSKTTNATRQLRFIPSLEHDGMPVQCSVEHPALEEQLTVEKTLKVYYPPKTSIKLPSTPILAGSEIEVECELEGANPPAREFRWMIDGEILENETQNVLKLEVAAAHHLQQISCEAFNGVQNAQQPSAGQIEVLFEPELVEKSKRVGVDPEDTEVELFCEFSGNPAPKIDWFLEDKYLGSGKSLILDARTTPVSAGSYSCIASNDLGKASSEILVVVKGPPTIISSNQQSTNLECAFMSEPAPSLIEIRNLETDEIVKIDEEIQFYNLEVVNVQNLPLGLYECKVENEFGSTSARISLYGNGLGASAKLGIIVGVLVVAIAMVLFSLIKMKVISNTRRFKLNQVPENDSTGDLESNRRSIVISKPFLQKHQSNPLHVLDSQLDAILDNHVEVRYSDINPSDSGSTHRSAADDGYATESGSNNKIAASIGSNFTNYEFEQNSNPQSSQTKLKVIWDDSLPHDYETKGLFVSNYRKQRSISQV